MNQKLKTVALWLGALLVVAFALLFFEADLLWKIQQRGIFLFSILFFKQTMVQPGGMLSYLGAFFTQFFYYPWLGVIMICCWWLLLMWLTKRAFNLPDKWNVLTLIPVAIVIIADMDMGYWVYVMKLRGYFYVPTLGIAAGTALLWAFRKLPEKLWVRAAYIVLVTLAGFPLMGTYALATVLLMGVWTWRLSSNRTTNVVLSAVSLLSFIAVPLLYYHLVYYETNLIHLYRTAIPFFSVYESYPVYYLPYYALAACFLMLAIIYRHEWKQPKTPMLQWMAQGCVLAVVAGCVYHFWYKDDNFHHELCMQRCVEKADWKGVVEEGTRQNSEPTRAIVMMHNLALSRLGRQCDEMYRFPKGSQKINTPLPVYMFHIAGRTIMYQYGLLNECHRICMEDGVEYGWNVELIQSLARCAILEDESNHARKYLGILRQTLFHGGWADHMEQLLKDPYQLSQDSETGPITHMTHYFDYLDSAEGYVERFLMTFLAQQDYEDPYFQEQAVLAAMWTREPELFWARFDQYLDLHPNAPVPRIIQEAAYLFGNMQHLEDVVQMPFDQGVKDSFQAFMTQLTQYQKHSMNGNQIKKALYRDFKETYYYEYFFLRNITYY